MRTYGYLGWLAFRQQFTYRAANLAGLLTNIFFGILRASVMTALYASRTDVAGMDLQQAITYTALVQAIIAYLQLFHWWEVIYAVRNGDIGSDLLKPMNYYAFWLARDTGRAVAHLLVRGLPLVLAYTLIYDISVPQSLSQWLYAAVTLVLCLLVSFGWRFLVNLTAFWTPDARGIGRLAFGLSWFFSGFLMPLRFFPDWFVRFCDFTPFPSMVSAFTEVYLGASGSALYRIWSMQVFWALTLAIACQLVMRAGVRKLVIQGG